MSPFDQDKDGTMETDPGAEMLRGEPQSGYKSWREKVVVGAAALLFVAMLGLFNAVGDTADAANAAKDAADSSREETLTNRSFGYQSRALTCVAIMRLGVPMTELPDPCLDPLVVVHYEPTP